MKDITNKNRDAVSDEDISEEPGEADNDSDYRYEAREDVASLKRHVRELQKENKELKNAKAEKGKAKSTSKGKSSEELAARLRKALATSIKAQMVYKPSLKRGSSRINVEIPNIDPSDIESILGSQLYAKAKKGPKQVTVSTSSDDLVSLFGCSLHKSLRYGASLCVKDEALKLTFDKESQILKATGACIMQK